MYLLELCAYLEILPVLWLSVSSFCFLRSIFEFHPPNFWLVILNPANVSSQHRVFSWLIKYFHIYNINILYVNGYCKKINLLTRHLVSFSSKPNFFQLSGASFMIWYFWFSTWSGIYHCSKIFWHYISLFQYLRKWIHYNEIQFFFCYI